MCNIIPKPNGPCTLGEERYKLPDMLQVELGGFAPWSLQAFCDRMGYSWKGGESEKPWLILERTQLPGEAYRLCVSENGIRIKASAEQGVIWALASLIQLVSENREVPHCSIADEPKYGHRGLNLDCARHYFPLETVKNVIDWISRVKMNVLHWHLVDDQSWRIESKVFPKLHQTTGEYYTQDEIRQVVEYARVRGVEVIPEIDLPGHTTGILAAYPEFGCFGKEVKLATCGGIYPIILCAGKESVFCFLEQIFDEICPLFPSARFHVGGDEAPKSEWKKCPDCQKRMKEEGLGNEEDLQGYFTRRIEVMLQKHGKSILCWNDSLLASNLPENISIQYWTVQHLASMKSYCKKGGEFIYSDMFELYLDYPHSMLPLKRVYGSMPRIGRINCAGSPELKGMECCIWTERVLLPEQLYRRIFPRCFALAEAAWSQKRNYRDFKARLTGFLSELDRKGLCYTEQSWWDPEGKARRQEAFDYVSKMFAEVPDEIQQETTGNVQVNIAFILGFIRYFFKLSDLLYLKKLLKAK